ncbi:MAG: hypothetical protein ACXVES_07525 [Actinomycetota bacterium]
MDDHTKYPDSITGFGYFCTEWLPPRNTDEQRYGGVHWDFVASESSDFSEPRDCTYTDAQYWYRNSAGTYIVKVNDPQRCDYPVSHPVVLTRSDGTRAVVFDANQFRARAGNFGPVSPRRHDQIAILNFPDAHSRHFRAVLFYFYDFANERGGEGVAISMTTIRRVIESVKFIPATL